MNPRHVVLQHLRRPIPHRVTLPPALLPIVLSVLVWLYILYWGERSSFAAHVQACSWDQWEQWPRTTTPHRLVFIADPQIVDPHTYPGRPWPLSKLTEAYTDLYMARNYRLINEKLDPDSIVFLGDLFDGGREWATDRAKSLKQSQRKKLEALGIVAKQAADEGEAGQEGTEVDGLAQRDEKVDEGHGNVKRAHGLEKRDADRKTFVPGENGRWQAWDQHQWDAEFARFGRIFFEPGQLYPATDRTLLAAYDVPSDPISVENGAKNVTGQQYATVGGKQRQVISSLPGNHDLGFGAGVQLAVRDRFHAYFGESNRVTIIGNHTFVSLDTPSLSAFAQYMDGGSETSAISASKLAHIWKPSMDFLENLRGSADKAVVDALSDYYPDEHGRPGFKHEVTGAGELSLRNSAKSLAEGSLEQPPQLPVILLSHIPLYRDPDTDCGRLRERGKAISIRAGYQYQNVVTRTLSNTIVSRVAAAGDIAYAFSGDDHDYCDVVHRYNLGGPSGAPTLKSVKEITVKSFSWAMGVRRPGFLLVSLWNPVDARGETVGTPLPTIQTQLCLLPDQLHIFIDYAVLFGCTLVVLLVRSLWVGLRSQGYEADEEDESTKMMLPQFEPPSSGTANGYSGAKKGNTKFKNRQRGSSMSTSSHTNGNGHLSVQRSYTARARSVSPALNGSYTNHNYELPNLQQATGPLIEKAGYYPQVRWDDPDDSDEESHVGEDLDSQAKWKPRRRSPGKLKRVVTEFVTSILYVGGPVGLWYWWLIGNG